MRVFACVYVFVCARVDVWMCKSVCVCARVNVWLCKSVCVCLRLSLTREINQMHICSIIDSLRTYCVS